jgi:hypothetical protein
VSRVRIAGIAVCLGALLLLVGSITDVFSVTRNALGGAILFQVLTGVGLILEQTWVATIARVGLWLIGIVAALMVVPDRDEVPWIGYSPGPRWQFAALALYLLLCIVLVGRVTSQKHHAGA